MKILFFAKGHESLTIEYLSAILKKAGHKVELLFDPGLDDLLGFFDLKFLKFRNDDFYIKKIKASDPDLIGFSCFSNLYPFVKEKVAFIKKHFDIPIVVGGIHPTLIPDYVIKNPDIDMICMGEGDEAIVELADKMERGVNYFDVANFWFKKNGQILKNPIRPLLQNLDSVPFPDRDLFYQYGCFAGTIYLLKGRGCPFTCSYCYNHCLQRMYRKKGKYVRQRSVENVILELEECIKKYQVKRIYSMDDTFALVEGWIEEFSQQYQRRINLPFFCHVRPGTLSKRIANSLKEANCKYVFYGIDSGNEQMRNQIMNRPMKNSVIIDDAKLLKENGIKIIASAMFGLPNETKQQMIDTVNLIKEIKGDFAYTYIYYPFPNTDSFKYCLEHHLIDEEAVEKIFNGESSIHKYSFLHSDNNDFVQVLKYILPFYIKFSNLKPLADWIIDRQFLTLGKLVFILTAPFTYSEYGRTRIREVISVAKKRGKLIR